MASGIGDDGFRPIDDRTPGPPRTWNQVALEAALVLPNVVKLLFRLMRDPRVPLRHKVLVGVVAGYVISPVDLVPDFLAGFGKIDDIVLVSVALDHLMSGTSEEIVYEHWDGSIDSLDMVRGVVGWASEVVPGALKRLLPR